MSLVKPALIIQRSAINIPDNSVGIATIPPNLFLLPISLADRVGPNSCEEDPSVQQLIPYIVLVDEQSRILTYTRGTSGAESKLVSKLSIGVGGHIDSLPPAGTSFHQWCVEEARRELKEEVGLRQANIYPMIFDGLIVDREFERDPDDESRVYVGQVHLGLLTVVRCHSTDIDHGAEAGIIDNKTWRTVEELSDPRIHSRLETWSALALSKVKSILGFAQKARHPYEHISEENP